MDTKKLKQMVILTDNLEIDDFLRLIRRKVRQYVFSDEFKFDVNLTLSESNYITIDFNVGSLKCRWSINERGFICYHNLECIGELTPYKGFLSKEEEKEFVKLFYDKIFKERDKTKEIQKLEGEIESLTNKLKAFKQES